MAASNSTPIQLYYSNTPGSVPTSTNMIIGELAINVPDGVLFYLDSSNNVNVIARTAATAGIFPNVTFALDGTKQYTAAAPWAVTNLSWATANTALTDAIYTQGVDAWQNAYSQIVYTKANNAGSFANGAFGLANTNASDILVLQGANAWQNTYAQVVYNKANNVGSYANGAFTQANTNASDITNLQGVDAYQNNWIGLVGSFANGAFDYANSIIATGGSIDSQARSYANGAFVTANNAGSFANGSYTKANAAYTYAQNAGDIANGAFAFANTVYSNYAYTALVNTLNIQGVDLTQNTSIQNSFDRANSAFDKANTAYTIGGGIAGSLANGAFDRANSSFDLANTNATNIVNIQAVDTYQNNWISSVGSYANGAFTKANAAVANTSSITLAGSLNVPGQANVSQRLAVGTGAYQILPNLIAQFTGTSDYYSQVNQQNLSGKGTGDFVVTADNGSDSVNYADVGFAGSVYDNTSPNAFPFVQPNDGYFMVVGNPGANFGGNVYIGTTGSAGYGDIVFIQGNTNDQVARFKLNDKIEFYRPLVANSFTTKDGVNVVTYTDTANTYLKGLIDTKVSKSGDTINGTLTVVNPTGANAAIFTGNVVISQDLHVSGNLYLGGNSTTISSNNLTLDDSIIYLANNNSGNLVDIGIVGHFITDHYQHTGFIRDHTDGKWKVFSNVAAEPTSTMDLTGAVYDTIKVGAVESVGGITAYGIDVLSLANGAFGLTNSASYVANTKVASVSGASGRITSTGGTTPVIDLDTTGILAGTYSYPQLHADAYGRITSISNQTPVTSFNTRTGSVTLTSGDVTGALTYTPVNSANYTTDQAVQAGVDATQNTVTTAVASYANGAFTKANNSGSFANGAFTLANTSYTYAVNAGDVANGAFYTANNRVSSVSGTSGRITSTGGLTPVLDLAASGVSAATYSYPTIQVDTYGRIVVASSQIPVTTFNTRNGPITLLSGDVVGALGYTPVDQNTYNSNQNVQAGVDTAQNNATIFVGTYANGAFFTANSAGVFANAAFGKANNAGSFANGAFSVANTALAYATNAGDFANGAFAYANNIISSGGSVDNQARSYANGAFLEANTAYTYAQNAGDVANGAFTLANTTNTLATNAGIFANSSFAIANGAASFANGAFTTANNAGSFANGSYVTANSAGSFANGAFTKANTGYTYAVNAGNFANSSFDLANTAYGDALAAWNKANTAINNQGGAFYTDVTGGTIPEFRADTNMAIRTNGTLYLETDSGLSAGIQVKPYGTPGIGYYEFTSSGQLFPDGSVQTTAYSASAFTTANNAGSFANGAFTLANTTNTLATNAGSFANGAFVEANSAASFANGSYTLANTNASNISTIQGVDAWQNAYSQIVYTAANNAGSFANGAFDAANTNATNISTLQGVNAWQNTIVDLVGSFANGAFTLANSAYNTGGILAGAYANAAFTTANSAGVFANAAFSLANSEPIGTSAGIFANAAFTQANTNTSDIVTIQGVNTWQNTYNQVVYTAANNAGSFANGAYNQANTATSLATVAFGQSNTSYSLAVSSFNKANSIVSPTYSTGTTPPPNPSTSAIWYNTTTDVMYQWMTSDGTNYYWIDIDSPTVTVGNTTISYTYTGYGRSAAMAIIFGGF